MPEFLLPTDITLPRKTKKDRKVYLNLNVYRNLHHQSLSQMKRAFYPIGIPEGFKAEKIRITYHVQKKTKRKYDIMNVVSIVDKCFCDWMVTAGYIPDDNLDHVDYGQITGENGCDENRVIAEIEILEKMR